jgi:hypothetical protein
MMLATTSAHAAVQDITVGGPPCNANTDFSYAAKPGDTVNEVIGEQGATGDVEWDFLTASGCSSVVGKVAKCGGLTITIPTNPGETVPNTTKPTLTGNPTAVDPGGSLELQVTDSSTPNPCGTRTYKFRTTSTGGGWGDPHMTTVDGVHYDFQGAGEFVALKEDKFEVQTRQRPVPTTTVPGASEYTGLAVCVSIYSAVAMRIGSNRVTLQPNLNGQPDPSTLQLRVNGNLVTTIPEGGLALRAGGGSNPKVGLEGALEGRIVRAAGGAYEFDAVDGTQLVATPAYWSEQQTWYLNLNVYQTSAVHGIWGRLASGSWLPALPDGTSLGPMPRPLSDRYRDLYDKFGGAWRVTNATSLFDYAPGTNTGTFTVTDWPRFGATSCLIQGQTPAQPTTPEAAAQACSAVTDPAQKADCTFDVTVTGNTGFAQTYVTTQGFRPHGFGWQPPLPGQGSTSGPGKGGRGSSSSHHWWLVLIAILVLVLILIVRFARKKKTP